jgi:hypothetical protein
MRLETPTTRPWAIKVHVDRVFPVAKVKEAFLARESGRIFGRRCREPWSFLSPDFLGLSEYTNGRGEEASLVDLT